MTEYEKLEECLQTIAAVVMEAKRGNPLSSETIAHCYNTLRTCKHGHIEDDGFIKFSFVYKVPEADTHGKNGLTIIINCAGKLMLICDEKGAITEDKFEIKYKDLHTKLLNPFLVDANATLNKINEAAKVYFINWRSNAKALRISNDELDDIINANNPN